ncbi:extracellular solute-binding protein [Bradyrhizobium sp. SSUT77]|uniref:extracellular solute-binding protein n=1 Tax=Bradyrhizobium sp. SSUT77 TaxID=3040603 RepID=UPI00244B6369|nr:extracellular solute-binding protein [Bradyrhizobium sp. SSUT77]MDH2348384.1 extracellular solute-binding protein [Bradyrhizobium sp. SSUT77]
MPSIPQNSGRRADDIGEFSPSGPIVFVSWDVIDGYSLWSIELCNQGLIEEIDWKKLGLDRSKFLGADKFDCGVPTHITAKVVAYDKDKLPNGPKTIADLFDTSKFRGKRKLYKSPDGLLEWALVADRVPVKDIYKVLRTPDGVDRAFRKLDTIKTDIIWWTSGAQPPQLLADGQVVMTAAWSGRIYDAIKNSGKHFEMMWDAATTSANVWIIPPRALHGGRRHISSSPSPLRPAPRPTRPAILLTRPAIRTRWLWWIQRSCLTFQLR